jgi:membrane-associated phospholipid phosphatase
MLSGFFHSVMSRDYALWYLINTQWHNSFFDYIIPFLRNQWFWVPLYVFLALWMPIRFRRNGMIWCLVFIFAFVLSDQLSAHLLKPIFHRLRPCNNPSLSAIIHLLVQCGSGYSFPSSHASNHFAIGVFMAITLGKLMKWIPPVTILWALIVSFSQVYVGVHFPLDVTCGGLLGASIGIATGTFFNYYFTLTKDSQHNTTPH